MVAQMAKNLPIVQETGVQTWIGKVPWRRQSLPIPIFFSGESHEQKRLLFRGLKELDTME